jgi:short-subunit dehydrogenase involved in D-alanine esterification of teichoic acids
LDYSKIITDKLNAIADEAQTEVEQLLEWIEQTENQLDKAINSAGVKRIDDIEFFGGGSDGPSKTQELRKEKQKYLNELSDFIGIPNRCSGSVMGCLIA